MILPHEEVYKVIGGNTPSCAARPTPILNRRNGDPKIQCPPHSRNLKLQPKLLPPLVVPPHQTSRANIEPPTPVLYEPPHIRIFIPQ